jgi:hypothetical protein
MNEHASAPEVGRAYRSHKDGITRWVTHRSHRGYLHLLWYSEDARGWFNGGKAKAKDWPGWYAGEEVPAPQAGDIVTMYGVFGRPDAYRVEADNGLTLLLEALTP